MAGKRTTPRKRAPVKNGYKKTTITIPSSTHRRFEKHLKSNPGLSMSAFLTDAGEAAIG
ncbi:hypothetical protein LCGC14_2037950 [marine sediment metagenome]|uniref:CopG family transcriptional regulator n=1 Tax=marine sediment metagenome TaxID=412755 RepID=A0A0F9ESY0_9ZZZZ